MAVRHDKCRAPSLFLPVSPLVTCRKDRKLVCGVESGPYHDSVTGGRDGTRRGDGR